MYLAIKHLHITCVALSLAGFLLRGLWMCADSPLLYASLTRRLPHIVDALLLGSAIALAVMSGQAPFVQAWLTAKVAGLLVYIVLGALAALYAWQLPPFRSDSQTTDNAYVRGQTTIISPQVGAVNPMLGPMCSVARRPSFPTSQPRWFSTASASAASCRVV